MAGNLKAFTVSELEFFLNKYEICIEGEDIVVACKEMKRKTRHPASRGFSLSTRVKKINITLEAIQYWLGGFRARYSLIEVQNAINTLKITYQKVNRTKLDQELKRIRTLLKESI